MACPYQAGSLQGFRGVSRDLLAVNDLGIGSGWQQSKQNWALPAVVGIAGQNSIMAEASAQMNQHDSTFSSLSAAVHEYMYLFFNVYRLT